MMTQYRDPGDQEVPRQTETTCTEALDLFSPPPEIEQHEMAIERLRERARRPHEQCDCCGGNIKVYRSPLGVTVRLLIWMALNSEPGDYVHVPSAPRSWLAGGGDYAKLRYWDLIEKCEDPVDPSKRASGRWRLTALGRDFVHKRASVPSHCFWQHPGSVLGFEVDGVGIEAALGKNFNYRELMRGEA